MLVEVYETIEIIQTVVIRIRSNAGKVSKILKQCQKNEKQIKSYRTAIGKIEKDLKSAQDNCQRFILKRKTLDDSQREIERRLPEIEAAVVRQTLLSANYLILKQQHTNHQVKYCFGSPFGLQFQSIFANISG